MCAYTAYIAQLSTDVCRPRSPKCNLPLGQLSCGYKLREGPWVKLPGFLERVHVCAIRVFFFWGGVPPHPSFEENISSPFRKLLIHSISVSGLLIAGVCLLSFLPFCARTLQCGKGRYMYGLVIDDEDAGFYTCLLQASKCCINKAENKTLPSSNQ